MIIQYDKNDRKIYKSKNPVFKKLLFSLINNSNHKFIVKKDVILSKKIDNYAENFGIQWNEFELTQFDSFTNLPNTENRLAKCTGWDLNKLKNKSLRNWKWCREIYRNLFKIWSSNSYS